MVRLFVPEGENQHQVTRQVHPALPAQPELINSPWRSCVAAAGFTALRAFAGRAVPGTFIKAVASWSVIDLSFTALGMYGRRDLNRTLLRAEGIEPRPGKLWQRTKHPTVEDMTVSGALAGLAVASWVPRFPGLHGWKRHFGLTIIGAACGSSVGYSMLLKLPPEERDLIQLVKRLKKVTVYSLLSQDSDASSGASLIGRLTGYYYRLQAFRIASTRPTMSPEAQRAASPSQMAPRNAITFPIIVDTDELAGPDIDEGFRAYKDDLMSRNVSALRPRLERLRETRRALADELGYVRYELARKEDILYNTAEDSPEKDICRREAQLLNSILSNFLAHMGILSHHIFDAEKQLRQLTDHPIRKLEPAPSGSSEEGTPVKDVSSHIPQRTTKQLRHVWQTQKEVLAQLEHMLSQVATTEHEPHNVNILRENVHQLTRNLEATSRLLSEFEEQVRKAEDQTRK